MRSQISKIGHKEAQKAHKEANAGTDSASYVLIIMCILCLFVAK